MTPSKRRRQGRIAYQEGTNCPYSMNSSEGRDWQDGWQEASDAEDAEEKEQEESDDLFDMNYGACPWKRGDDCAVTDKECTSENCPFVYWADAYERTPT